MALSKSQPLSQIARKDGTFGPLHIVFFDSELPNFKLKESGNSLFTGERARNGPNYTLAAG
jgi:hypothetical protein